MKVTYDEKTNSDFTPFRLILEFNTAEDVETFYSLFGKEVKCSASVKAHELFHKILDVITNRKKR